MMYLYVYLSNVLRDLKEEAGQGMAEYALILALIAIVVALALPTLASAIGGVFGDVATDMGAAGGGG